MAEKDEKVTVSSTSSPEEVLDSLHPKEGEEVPEELTGLLERLQRIKGHVDQLGAISSSIEGRQAMPLPSTKPEGLGEVYLTPEKAEQVLNILSRISMEQRSNILTITDASRYRYEDGGLAAEFLDGKGKKMIEGAFKRLEEIDGIYDRILDHLKK